MILLLSLITVAVSKKIGDMFFPDKMNTLYRQFSIVGINTLSQVYNISNYIYNVKEWCFSLFENTQTKLLFIKDGHERRECDVSHMTLFANSLSDYDLILYKERDYSNSKYKYNVIRLDSDTYINVMLKEQTIKATKNEFLCIQVMYKNKTYTIDFGVDNYYIAGNILFDKPFITWYLNAAFGVLIDDASDYICNIMDQNINIITLNSSQYILIENNKYNILNDIKKN